MLTRPSPCPVCGGRFRRSWVGSTPLFVCDEGCTGRSIAARLGLRLEDGTPLHASLTPRRATRRGDDDVLAVPALPEAS